MAATAGSSSGDGSSAAQGGSLTGSSSAVTLAGTAVAPPLPPVGSAITPGHAKLQSRVSNSGRCKNSRLRTCTLRRQQRQRYAQAASPCTAKGCRAGWPPGQWLRGHTSACPPRAPASAPAEPAMHAQAQASGPALVLCLQALAHSLVLGEREAGDIHELDAPPRQVEGSWCGCRARAGHV